MIRLFQERFDHPSRRRPLLDSAVKMNMMTHDGNRAVRGSRGFTLIELLVVIGIIAVLAAILLPALAAAKRKSLRAQDIDNMKQQTEGSIMYAGDFNDWYPPITLGNANSYPSKIDYIDGLFYLRWIEYDPTTVPGNMTPLAANQPIPPKYEVYNQNQGYLYGGGYIGNPGAFFCPALQEPELQEGSYSSPVFMSSDAGTNGTSGPSVRCPYVYNPRLVTTTSGGQVTVNMNPPGGSGGYPERAYQKSTQVHQTDVFISDYMDTPGSGNGMPFSPNYWAQYPSKGIEVAFTDGSVKFINVNVEYTSGETFFYVITTELQNTGAASSTSYNQFNTIWNLCQGQ